MQIPVIFFSYGDAEERVNKVLEYKKLYNTVKRDHLENDIEDDQVQEIYNTLSITDFHKPFLNTVIYFEDCVNNQLFKKPTNYFPQLVAKCRHNGLILFFAVQYWKGLPTELKANASTIYIFRDFSKQQILYIFHQTPLKHNLYHVYETYQRLRGHERLVIDAIKGQIIIDKT
jgi:hypothetical protein